MPNRSAERECSPKQRASHQFTGNTAREIRDKTAAYFAAGVREVWICDRDGKISFYGPAGSLERSLICPDFPREIPAMFLRHQA